MTTFTAAFQDNRGQFVPEINRRLNHTASIVILMTFWVSCYTDQSSPFTANPKYFLFISKFLIYLPDLLPSQFFHVTRISIQPRSPRALTQYTENIQLSYEQHRH